MDCKLFINILLILAMLAQMSMQAKKQKTSVITDIGNIKDFKKLLRTKSNVMVLFINDPKSSQSILEVYKAAADSMKGQASLVIVDCTNNEGKKLCKKLKVESQKPYVMKHYENGDYHKDYDRNETVSAMCNFLRDPTGELPWEEDSNAKDVVFLPDGDAITKFLRKASGTNKRSMIMFYSPGCSFCTSMKPDYIKAATELKSEAMLGAIDVARPDNTKIRRIYNITGFPTLYYYDKGLFRFAYNGDTYWEDIVDFMRKPSEYQLKKRHDDEIWSEDTDVVHLSSSNFDQVLEKAEHALVVFYAPWCGHCKRLKLEFENAASRIKAEKINGILAAVDVTKHSELGSRFEIRGYPTLKYFNKGEFKLDAGHARKEEQIVDFIKDPREPPPPPPQEKPWNEEESSVRHLDSSTFRNTLRKVKHAIVMFYAPWCGHCKSTKPEFVKASDKFADELMVAFGAVDCTTEANLCKNYDVKGYPTIKYFSYFDKQIKDYNAGRKEADFVSYIHGQMGHHETKQAAAATPQEAGFGGNVQLAFDKDYEEIIANPTPTFIMFYASWCSHCIEVKPAFSRLATNLKDNNVPVNVVAIDAAENAKVADLAGIQTLPTLKIFAGGKELATYDGDRSLDDMVKFCKSYAKVKDEL